MPPPAKALRPARELMLMISPAPRWITEGATARETRKTLLRLVSRTRSQSASVFSWAGPKRPMPALFTRMEIGPRVDWVLSTRELTSAERETSAISEKTGWPEFCNSAAAAESARLSWPQMETAAPSWARRRAMARPMPRVPPVTRATAPESGGIWLSGERIVAFRAI